MRTRPSPAPSPSRRRILGGLAGLVATTLLAGCATESPPAQPASAPPAPTETPTPRVVLSFPQRSPTPTLPPPTPTPHVVPLVFAPPARLLIPKIGVDAPIVAVGLTPDGAMEAPDGPIKVGWYRGSPHPGQPGNALLTGHVDWHTDLGVFWYLRELKAGDPIQVKTESGETLSFAVDRATSYPKDQAPLAQIFGFVLGVAITIVTCDGTFSRTAHDYDQRLVVRALRR